MDRIPWRGETREGWLREVHAWIREGLTDSGLAGAGRTETVKDRPWAIVLRVRGARACAYFKASGPGGLHEPALVRALAGRWPERVLAPLACDAGRGWMLSPDGGPTLRATLGGSDGLAHWERLLPAYAELQLDSAGDAERWLALGVPDRRLPALHDLLSDLLDDDAALRVGWPDGLAAAERAAARALLPELAARCGELGALPCAAALDHGDLHDDNILVGDAGDRLFDWGDASVTHPFVSLLVTCHAQVDDLASADGLRRVARLRDAYLEPWTKHAPPTALRELFPLALWVAHVSRALDWSHMLQASGGLADHEQWAAHLPRWLRLWVARRPGT